MLRLLQQAHAGRRAQILPLAGSICRHPVVVVDIVLDFLLPH
jgi:uncharacterized heparinase superfamily protein